jgi:4-amino-4-deoxy-L-arabinose transferase-like glycosyltransferase
VVRAIVAVTIGLGVDESYTASASRQFGASYYDHPPMSFWIAWATRNITGSESALVLRLPFILLFAGTTWMMYRLGARLFDDWAGVWAAVMLNLAAVFSISTGGWILPDGPLMFFLLGVALCLARVLFEPRTAHVWPVWLAAGALLGCALLSKYHAVLTAAGLLLFLITSRAHRRWLVHPAPYLGAFVALVLFSPVLFWNYEHDWVSFLFQAGRGAPRSELRPHLVLVNILGQAAWILPWIWVPLVWCFLRALAAGPTAAKPWFLACLALWPIAVFSIVPLWGSRGLPHWQAPGYLFAFPLLGAFVSGKLSAGSKATRRWVQGSVGAMLVLAALLASHTATGWGKVAIPSAFRAGDPSLEALDWWDLRDELSRRGLLERADVFVVATHWIDAGKIDYALGGRLPVLVFTANPKHFAFMNDPRDFVGRDGIVIGRPGRAARAVEEYAAYFETIEPIGAVTLRRAGRPEIELALYLGKGLRRAYPLPFPRRAQGG